MAKPGELAELIARLFKLEEATVRQQARELRDHGLMSKEKGGRGAGSMTALDAAHLLVAAAATTSVKKSAEVVRKYQACIANEWRGSPLEWNLSYLPAREIQSLRSDHSIVDFIEAAIIAFCSGQWSEIDDAFGDGPFDIGKFLLNVGLGGPATSASVSIIQMTEPGKKRSERPAGEMHSYGDNMEGHTTDYSYHYHFGHRSLMAVGKLLRM